MTRALLFAAALALMPTTARAEEAVDLSGAWSFTAHNNLAACDITGNATITPSADAADTYAVHLIAEERCVNRSPGTAEQMCVGTRSGDHLSVRCEIIRLSPRRAYIPDDFELNILGFGLMRGQLTANWNQPAIWSRSDAHVPVS